MTLTDPKIYGFVNRVTIQEDKVYSALIKNKIFIQYFAKKHLAQKLYKNILRDHFY